MNIKTLISLLIVICTLGVINAQVPQSIKYQSVIRNSDGNPVTNKIIKIRLSVVENNPGGNLVYKEEHITETNDFGLVNLNLGKGSGSYNFSDINWQNGTDKWLKVEIDTSGGTNFLVMGSSKLLSVPYALYAENAGNNNNFWTAGSNGIFYNSGNAGIGTNNPDTNAILELNSDSRGFLPPRLTKSQRNAINNPPLGLTIFNTTSECLNIYKKGAWYELCGTCMPPPQPDITSNSPACKGGKIKLHAINTGGANCHWQGPSGFTSSNQNPEIYNADSSKTGYYKLYLSNQCGNSDTDSVYVSLTDVPASADSISGNDSVCAGIPGVIYETDTVHGADSYIWDMPAGFTITDGDSTESIIVSVADSANSGVIKVTPHNKCGHGMSSPAKSVTVIQPPSTADAGQDKTNIQSDSVVLNANYPAQGQGFWSIDSGSGGNILNPSDPKSVFKGTPGNSYVLEWEISNFCGTSSDKVTIHFAQPFSCGDSLYDPRDGQKYATVKIGTQCWMAENLNIGQKVNGSTLQTNNGIIEKYCYNNNTSNCDIYGGLYQWVEMMQLPDSCYNNLCSTLHFNNHQGICPPGWHVPTDTEYKTIEMSLGMTQTEANLYNTWRGAPVGDSLKQGGSSGFNVLLSGRYQASGSFALKDNYEYPYTASEYGSNNAWRRCISSSSSDVGRWNTFPKNYGFSVRCVKNN